MRVKEDQHKKSEKERLESKKIIEGKEVAVEKLRKERDELWAVVNTDKYKNLRTIEQDREKAERQRTEVEGQLKQLKEEHDKALEKIKETEGKIHDLELQSVRHSERDQSRERLLEVLEEKSRKKERELDLNE